MWVRLLVGWKQTKIHLVSGLLFQRAITMQIQLESFLLVKNNLLLRYRVMVFNATVKISFILWQSFLLVEETGENHRPVASHIMLYRVHLTLSGIRTRNVSCNSYWLHGYLYIQLPYNHGSDWPNKTAFMKYAQIFIKPRIQKINFREKHVSIQNRTIDICMHSSSEFLICHRQMSQSFSCSIKWEYILMKYCG